jgi:hypothetical protein
MIRAVCFGFAACSFVFACGPPVDGPLSGELAPGAVCVHNDECQSGNCEKLFVCEEDRAVSCNRDQNDCPANGLPDSACVEEQAGTCSPSPVLSTSNL